MAHPQQHSAWCDNLVENPPPDHDSTAPYCEHQVAGIKGVAWPPPDTPVPWIDTVDGSADAETWVSVVSHLSRWQIDRVEPDGTNGVPDRYQHAQIGIAHSFHDGTEWHERAIHITSGAARSFAAALVAAADISERLNLRLAR